MCEFFVSVFAYFARLSEVSHSATIARAWQSPCHGKPYVLENVNPQNRVPRLESVFRSEPIGENVLAKAL